MFGEEKINEIQSILMNVFRVGKVTSVDATTERARVVFDDRDETESYDLQVIVRNTKLNKDHCMPDLDEDVLCAFLPVGVEQGFILGSFYTDLNSPPSQSENVRKVTFSDGTVIEYDRESNKLTASVQGDIDITATGNLTANVGGDASLSVGGSLSANVTGNSDITTPKLTLNGNLVVNGTTTTQGLTTTAGLSSSGGGVSVQGDMNINNGDITADGISVKQHTHIDAEGRQTGTPQ